jgi:hypothetical protein
MARIRTGGRAQWRADADARQVGLRVGRDADARGPRDSGARGRGALWPPDLGSTALVL